jgi:beta-N-acetylhexosaminidase
MIALELKAVGVNLNFSPVADILTNPKNTVIGDRAWGTTEEAVSKFVTPMVRGQLGEGVQACIKHFPGHGGTDEDSHYALPKINVPVETLRNREFKPFSKAFRSHCAMVMTAHIVNSAIDPDFPATFSSKTLQGLLRNELRFSGVIVSDDMEMQAVTDHFGAESAPVLAIQGGCDLLCYRSETAARKAYAAVLRALEDGQLDPGRILDAAGRLRNLKSETFGPDWTAPAAADLKLIGSADHLALVQGIC